MPETGPSPIHKLDRNADCLPRTATPLRLRRAISLSISLRSPLTSGGLLVVAAAAITTLLPTPQAEAASAAPSLRVSTSVTRNGSKPLAGATVSKSAAIFVSGAGKAKSAEFYVDNARLTGRMFRKDLGPELDLAGTARNRRAVAFDTNRLRNGKHRLSVRVRLANNKMKVLHAVFTVSNKPAAAKTAQATATEVATPVTTTLAPTTTVAPVAAPTTTVAPVTTTAAPTTTVAPTTTTAPRPAFPDASTTGVPAGVKLTPMSGTINITKAGTVIDAAHITGSLYITAKDVRITRSKITGPATGIVVRTTATGSVTIEDTEITGGGAGQPVVCCSAYTLRRVNIHDTTEGPRLGDNTLIEDTYIHHLQRCPGCHIDAVQSTAGTNITVRRSNLQAYNPVLKDPMNAAFQFGETTGLIRNCLFEGNLLNGGNFTVNGGGGGTTGAVCSFRKNTFGRDYRYGAFGNLGPSAVLDATNVFGDTGLSVRG
jgi:hypothetical protein